MATLTLELDNVTESRLQQRSQKEGRKREELATNLLANLLQTSDPVETTEAHLLEKINQGWNEAEWKRYHALVTLRKANRLTEAEYQELVRLTNERETAHAKRLHTVLELAKLRGISFEETLKQLGIEASAYVE